MVAAVRITGWTHIHCFAHTLNLVVQEAIKNDPTLLLIKKKCKDIVTFFHQSVNAAEKLRVVQRQVGIQENKLIQEVETRWNSTFYMFERIVEQHQAVTTALCLLNRNNMCLSAAELQQLKSAVTVLQPFEAATTETSAEKFFSVSALIPLAKSLMQFLAQSDKISLVNGLQAQLLRRFGTMEGNHHLAAATLLDPRLKKFAFRDQTAAQQGMQWLIQEMSSLSIQTVTDINRTTKPIENSNNNNKYNLWAAFDLQVKESQSSMEVVGATLQGKHYMEEKILQRKDDPLKWWKEHDKHYTLLSILALKYLSIPGTSVPSERVFSKAGELVSARRSRIKPKNVDMFLFINKNLREI